MKIKYVLAAAGIVSMLAGAPGFAQADNTNSRIAQSNPDVRMENRILVYPDGTTQEFYIDREHHHWYGVDRHHRGPTIEEWNEVYGYEPNPTRIAPPSDETNPTGNELRGQNGGGK